MSLPVSFNTGDAIETIAQINARNKAIGWFGGPLDLGGAGEWDYENDVFLAETDGLVLVTKYTSNGTVDRGYSDASNPPTTQVFQMNVPSGDTEGFGCFPVRAGDYWKVTPGTSNSLHIFFLPLTGGVGKPSDFVAGDLEDYAAMNTRNAAINAHAFGNPVSKSIDTLYQATVQGFVTFSSPNTYDVTGYCHSSDNSANWGARADDNTPAYNAMADGYLCETDSFGDSGQLFFLVPKDWYYMIRKNTGSGTGAYTMNFIPHGS